MDAKEKARDLFQQGAAQAKAGQKKAARKYLRQAVSLDVENEATWLYLAGVAGNRQEALEALKRAERLNPANPHLKKAKAWLAQTWPDDEASSPAAYTTDGENGVEAPAGMGDDAPADPTRRLRAASTAKAQSAVNGQWPTLVMKTVVAALAAILVVAIGLMVVVFSLPSDAAATFITDIVATPTNTIEQDLALRRQEFEAARNAANQPAMIAALEEMRALDPDDVEIAAQLSNQYFDQGMILRNGGNFEAAQQAFKHALKIKPEFEAAAKESELVGLYLTGVKRHQEANWSEAAAVFEELYRQDPAYPFAAEILYSSLYNLGLVKQNQGEVDEALQTFEQAGLILPHTPEAEKKIIELIKLLTPPTPLPNPTPTPEPQKRVVVDISEQRAYVYEGDALLFDFIISTGEPGRDTAVGQFEILNKIPVAYASAWNLDMPNWLGIYWSGSLQNGFHALPTVRHTGYTLWDGFLGQRVSYGCIILSYADSQILYNWVDIGTPVTIRY